MMHNYKMQILSHSSMTQVALAISKLVLYLEEKNRQGYKIVVLSVNTSCAEIVEGIVVFQIVSKESESASFDFNEINEFIDKIEKKYNVKIIIS